MRRNLIVLLALACLVATVAAEKPKADAAKAKPAPSFATLSSAVTAAANAPQLTTLITAVKAAGVAGALTPSKWQSLDVESQLNPITGRNGT